MASVPMEVLACQASMEGPRALNKRDIDIVIACDAATLALNGYERLEGAV